ncbi:hypothetical protein [Streptomyces sp. CT34]|uniref:hypothetical protein n=1 Tax=Streptomyces sp. CT34 TaxID=1553907 RepID=UPI000691FF71|nr:hypothetical protein [Streptomyces sp. CT34]
MPLLKQHCRLCWHQGRLERSSSTYTLLLPHVSKVRHHQLYLADLIHRVDLNTTAHRRARAAAQPLRSLPPSAWHAPPLFEHHVRDYDAAQRPDLRKEPIPDNPVLHRALHVADERRQARGWSEFVYGNVRRGLLLLLARHPDGEPLYASQHHQALRRLGCIGLTNEILSDIGLLVDDRPAALDRWITKQLAPLSPAFATPAGQWVETLRRGGPRSRPRSTGTVITQLVHALPALKDWCTRYDHLREVTRQDVLDHLAPLTGWPRNRTLTALRSLLRWSKQHQLIFQNPCHHIQMHAVAHNVLQPLEPQDIKAAIDAVDTPAQRLAIALAAIYAARSADIRALRLDDVDLPGRTLAVAGRTHRLDDLTWGLLHNWLAYRTQRWPHTANPYLLINHVTAVRLTPASSTWPVGPSLRGLPATLERLRIDRLLEEALTNGPDPLHLAEVFGLSSPTAIRYADSARQLLADPAQNQPLGFTTNPSAGPA